MLTWLQLKWYHTPIYVITHAYRTGYASGRTVHHLSTSRVVYTSSLGPSHTNICIKYRKLSLKTITRKHPYIQCANCTFRIYALLFPSLRWTHGPKCWKLQNMFLSLKWTIMFLMTVVFFIFYEGNWAGQIWEIKPYSVITAAFESYIAQHWAVSLVELLTEFVITGYMTFPWNMTYEMSH